MSLPNYLSKIKSSGIYHFVWDKSIVPTQQAETLRLVVGYSEKGPFNTPVYIDNTNDFINIYGRPSKRLEKKGIFFHRMAIQALAAGPILALNLKKFDKETIQYVRFDNISDPLTATTTEVKSLYNSDRFWKLDADILPDKLNKTLGKYYILTATDTKDTSCTTFMRKSTINGYDITIAEWYASYFPEEEIPTYLEPIKDTKLSNYFMDIYVFRGDITKDTVKEGSAFGYYGSDTRWVGYFNVSSENDNFKLNSEYKNALGQSEDALDAFANNEASNFISKYQGCTIPYFKDANGNYISIDLLFNSDYDSHKMLMKLDESVLDGKTLANDITNILEIKGPEGDPTPHICLEGYTYISPKDYTGNSLSVLQDAGIYTALTNNVDVQYHYIVDTYQSTVKKSLKSELSLLAKDKGNAFAILNFPPMSDVYAGNTISAELGLVSEQNGASYCAYYTQLKFSDGTVKSIIPSAALVSNLFMEKWGSRQPYYVVAGPNYGLINYDQLVGPDFNYGRKELDILEPMGVNAIIYVPRKGIYINSNQTAKQNPVSALSKIHIRELVIYLQDEVEAMLQNYQWELNTATLRSTVKAKADAILEKVQNNGGVYAYRNTCDETNNTPEVIDNEMIILDTELEPARAAGKMIFRLKIHKTGGLTAE